MTHPCASRRFAVQDARVKVRPEQLISAVPAIVSKSESRIGAVLLKAMRGVHTRGADYAMPCRFFCPLPGRHIVGIGVATAGEITERAALRSDGPLRRWD